MQRPAQEVIVAAALKNNYSVVKLLYDSLSDLQRQAICFDWEYLDPNRGLLRTRISNNWRITRPSVKSDFFTTAVSCDPR